MRLEQKRLFKKQTFVLDSEKLKITQKSISNFKEWSINIEHIGDEISIEKSTRKGAIITAIFCLVAFSFFLIIHRHTNDSLDIGLFQALAIIYLFVGVMILFSPTKGELTIVGGREVVFFVDSPSEEVVKKFAEALIIKSKEYLKTKYAKIDPDLPEEMMISQLNWLKIRGVITEKEYKLKTEEYKTSKLL